jgi:mono/diheme cytochrome c family protein
MKKLFKLTIATLLLVFLSSTISAQQSQPNWTAPAKYKTMKGKGDSTVGKTLFVKHCKSCHGAKGLGDGPKSASLKTFPGNFSDKKFQSKTDGELYFISIVGSNEMPNFEKKIIDEQDRWSVVNYIRTLK